MRRYIEDENAYTRAQLAHCGPLRSALRDELRDFAVRGAAAARRRVGAWLYYARAADDDRCDA